MSRVGLLRLEDIDRPATRPRASAWSEIAQANVDQRTWTIVLDDDPTGTQTVQNVTVVMAPWPKTVLEDTAVAGATTFLLTNSRSLDAVTAARLTAELVDRAASVSRSKGLRLRVLSRSDSTLRGHFKGEVTAAKEALSAAGLAVDGVLFAPCYLEAGRYTALNAQWVAQGENLINAAHTEFAEDATFGYSEPDLRDWVVARMRPGVVDVQAIGLSEIRSSNGREAAATKLLSAVNGQVLIANAVRPDDLEVVVLALQAVEAQDKVTLIRCGPSLVRVCAGQPPRLPVRITYDGANPGETLGNGLLIVGSHTDLTNRQLAVATKRKRLVTVELDVERVLSNDQRTVDNEIARVAAAASDFLESDHVAIRTSRTVALEGRATPLMIASDIARALTAAAEGVFQAVRPRFVLAKGGITSSEIATGALGASLATVAGQLLPGQIPLWTLCDGIFPKIPYVVFPGNVGSESALADVLSRAGVPDV